MKRLTLASLCMAAIGLTGGQATAQQNGKHPLDAGFAKADTNKDGFLDAAELAKAFRGPNAKVIEDKAGAKEIHLDHQFMDKWDANKDGKISKAEFEKHEQQEVAAARAANNQKRNFVKARPNYRNPRTHRGYANRGGAYGNNPYTAQLRYMQRTLQQQRQFIAMQQRYLSYSPYARGGYRGVMVHGRR